MRLHRYNIAQKVTIITEHVRERSYGFGTLVAFSGGAYQLLIVANKIQTGFDQPKLIDLQNRLDAEGLYYVAEASRFLRRPQWRWAREPRAISSWRTESLRCRRVE